MQKKFQQFNPFMTGHTKDEFFRTVKSLTSSRTYVKQMIWSVQGYFPFWSLRFFPSDGDLFTRLTMVHNSSDGPTSYLVRDAVNAGVRRKLSSLWQRKEYDHIAMAHQRGIVNSPDVDNARALMKVGFDSYVDNIIYAPNDLIYPAGLSRGATPPVILKTPLDIIRATKGKYFKAMQPAEIGNTKFLVDRYFITEYVRTQPVTLYDNDVDNYYSMRPLLCMVFKSDSAIQRYIRAHDLVSKAPDPSTFELWVDDVLADPKHNHPLHAQFVRAIKNPMLKGGVTIKIFPCLRKELFGAALAPKFKSIQEKNDFMGDMVTNFFKYERQRLKILTPEEIEAQTQRTVRDLDDLLEQLHNSLNA